MYLYKKLSQGMVQPYRIILTQNVGYMGLHTEGILLLYTHYVTSFFKGQGAHPTKNYKGKIIWAVSNFR